MYSVHMAYDETTKLSGVNATFEMWLVWYVERSLCK